MRCDAISLMFTVTKALMLHSLKVKKYILKQNSVVIAVAKKNE